MTLNEYLNNPPQLVGPSYNIYHYTDSIYKVVHFKAPRLLVDQCRSIDRTRKGSEKKLASAVSRARKMVLEYGLCNHWEWFATFTLDKTKYDRYNLDVFYKDFAQWIRDQRKTSGKTIRYLLVPELHQDGAWHMHGLLSDLPGVVPFSELRRSGWKIPDKLVRGNYSCWIGYHNKFGFNSLGAISSPVGSAFYITKYVGKDLSGSSVPVGRHLYYACRGLNRSVLHGSVYGPCPSLDRFTVNDYQWCKTGFTSTNDELDWSFALEFVDAQLPLPSFQDYGVEPVPDRLWFEMQEGIQETLEEFR